MTQCKCNSNSLRHFTSDQIFINKVKQYYFVAVAQLETRKFKGDSNPQNGFSEKRVTPRSCSIMSDQCSLDSSIEMCAICLEEYKDSQVGIHQRNYWPSMYGLCMIRRPTYH